MKFNSYMTKSYKPISRTSIHVADKAFKNLRVLLKRQNDPIRFGGPMQRISLEEWWFSRRSPIAYYTQNDRFSDLYSTAIHIGDMQYISDPIDF
jgi:hypothetical protein